METVQNLKKWIVLPLKRDEIYITNYHSELMPIKYYAISMKQTLMGRNILSHAVSSN